MANEVGVIGQTYENRKNHKIGVIESRDEKCKTLMMRDPDGRSFVVTFSTFRSNWRKSGEEVIATSTQVEEKKQTVKKAEEKIEKKARASKVDIREKLEIIDSEKQIVQPIVDKSSAGLKLTTSSKGAIVIKKGRSSLFEIWNDYKNGNINICVKETIKQNLQYSEKTGDVAEEFKDNFILKWVLTIDRSRLASLVEDLISAAEQVEDDKEKEGEE